ncbi:MAG: putative Ig domain-containing protein [Anaeromyxobacteraceae bacterium]
MTFAPDALPDAQVGQEYTVEITVSGNETPVSSMRLDEGSLPPGIVLVHRSVQSTGLLQGMPAQGGTFAFSLRASCFGTNLPGQEGTKAYVIVVR